MEKSIINYSYWSVWKKYEIRFILWLSDVLRLIFTIVYVQLKKTYLAIRDCLENINYTCPTLDTHHYETKILLINRLRNKM